MKEKRPWYECPQPVINRYFQMRMNRVCNPWIGNLTKRYVRIKLYFPERRRRRAFDAALEETVKNFESIRNSKHESVKVLFNVQLFFLIAEKDFHTVKLDALAHPNRWKRNLALRVALLTIHELDLSKAADARKLSNAFDAAGIDGELRKEMNDAMRKVNRAQGKAKKALSELRHSTIAHRDGDALHQYRMITEADSMHVLGIIGDFYEGAEEFIKVLPKALLASSRLPALVSQLQKSA